MSEIRAEYDPVKSKNTNTLEIIEPQQLLTCEQCKSGELNRLHHYILKTDCPRDCERYRDYQFAIAILNALKNNSMAAFMSI